MIARIALALCIFAPSICSAADPSLKIDSPLPYQIFQRQSRGQGVITIAGHVEGTSSAVLEFRFIENGAEGSAPGAWKSIPFAPNSHDFKTTATIPAGGWYTLDVRLREGDRTVTQASVDRFGVGEVFVIAGQSNSTNYGPEPQKVSSDHVASFDGRTWRIADDPQLGVQDRSRGGSFLPAFGDAMYAKYKVPIGVASAGAGSTSVRQWLPKGHKIDVHPTTNSYIKEIGPNQWESTGQLYDGLIHRIQALGPRGFRALLWHQGESDAGQARAGFGDRQISAEQYRKLMEELIADSRKDAGWDFPWFVAQATYHSADDPSDPEFRAAQKSLWDSGVALPGPDTDALVGDLRAGVHFNAKGLQAHGKLWAEKVQLELDAMLAREPAGRAAPQ
ncbi:MAG TPA: sialate O-acetylesterase [Humisphaera sp.]|jgi:hypothetical protein|nr:sialate O-acetylesterase [Humisphaera sp.]